MGQGHVKMCLLVLSIKKMATVKRVVISVSRCAIYNKPKSAVSTIFFKRSEESTSFPTLYIKLCNIFKREFSFESSPKNCPDIITSIIFQYHRRRKLLISGLNDLCNCNCIEPTFINNFTFFDNSYYNNLMITNFTPCRMF